MIVVLLRLLLLFESGQTEEEAQNPLQVALANICREKRGKNINR